MYENETILASFFVIIHKLTFIFGLFLQMNATDLGEIKVDRGKKNYKNMGHVISINGETGRINFSFSFDYIILKCKIRFYGN